MGCDGSVDLTHYLSPFQVQELVLMEREAAINEMEAALSDRRDNYFSLDEAPTSAIHLSACP